ncbi:hypothetical protein OB2597_10289 [Pseudooceanicola batsensis HTCC2597]|uniref:Uncharacterized protein n=1 Tax=Pseudooceanicola batsensis (strain ATCC BAA-863 / DSM 15984 / KCTC 12145 / HTCC2597) TaxID=252305 RepID=A3TVI0_PSEBH|nr:hypothetical protein [Pseudooceanicola batsensis]EAQ04526.1 hypothetical protein OB2597_10289 [Pseudooceanicola batsensis HTCC2597]
MLMLRDALSSLWTQLNPKEPGIGFLVAFMATALTIFALGLIIGAGAEVVTAG